MRKTFIINFIAGPGAGKTTIAALVFAKLKIKGYVCEYVQEYAKTLVWTKEFETLNNQYYVSDKQYNLFSSMVGEVDFIITDGPLVHGLYYNRHNLDNTSNIEKTEQMILDRMSKLNNINIFLKRGGFVYEKEGRMQTESEALEIDVVIQHFMRKFEIEYEPFDAKPELIDSIVEYVEEFLKE